MNKRRVYVLIAVLMLIVSSIACDDGGGDSSPVATEVPPTAIPLVEALEQVGENIGEMGNEPPTLLECIVMSSNCHGCSHIEHGACDMNIIAQCQTLEHIDADYEKATCED